jgi:hypothetical protein
MTPLTKMANDLIVLQTSQDNESLYYNRNFASALERATKDTILESEKTS